MPSPSATTEKKVALRRSHRKSRNGCQNCKRRRIKCDETKPACVNCVKFSVHCDFSPVANPEPSEGSTSNRPSSADRVSTTLPRRRGRPRKNWDTFVSSNGSNGSGQNPQTSESPSNAAADDLIPGHDLNASDIGLMHQWLTGTYTTLVGRPQDVRFWRIDVPKIGQQFHFVLHLVLAFSARHLAHKEPEEREKLIIEAEHHFTIGLRDATKLLPHLNRDNCHSLYISTVLVCLYRFAKGPVPGDFLVFSDQGPALWMPLLRGVRYIIETVGPDAVFSGRLTPLMEPEETRLMKPTVEWKGAPRIDWEEPLQAFRQFVIESSSSNCEVYVRALDGMLPVFEATYGAKDGKNYTPEVNQAVFIWLYFIEDDFVTCLQHKEPIPLLILAHFALLMTIMSHHWYLRGWVEHILDGVQNFLSEEYYCWLSWPKEQAQLALRTYESLSDGWSPSVSQMLQSDGWKENP